MSDSPLRPISEAELKMMDEHACVQSDNSLDSATAEKVTITDLPPDVRPAACRCAREAFWNNDRSTHPGAVQSWGPIVDAVVAVVIPEIERPLQARIEELEAANTAVEEENDLLREVIQQKHARVEVLTAALTEIAREDCLNRVVREDGYCFERWPDGPLWCMPCKARAALAAGTTDV